MLDIRIIRENPETVKKAIKARGSKIDIESLLGLDIKRRGVLSELESKRAEQNKQSKSKPTAEEIENLKKTKEAISSLEENLNRVESEFINALSEVPNVPLPDVPEGDESHNLEIAKGGENIPEFKFVPKDHLELGEKLGIIDVERASKVSGSRFAYLKGAGAMLEFALIQFVMEKLIKNGFTPVIPPALIHKDITAGLGYWQTGGNENYYLVTDKDEGKENNLYLIGTGEHAVVPMHKDEVMAESDLPKKYAAFSSCFRREAGTYGKDMRGIMRVHQFDKVEMVAFVRPEDDERERRAMLDMAREIMDDLKLPYCVVKLAAGDISIPAAETIDIETWIPSQNKYRETHSISTTTDYQARRLNIKYQHGDKREFVHILNGTAAAIGRTIMVILENYQKEDGSVEIPKVLRPYMGGLEVIEKEG